MFWDFISLRPETTHQVSFLFADRGIPDGYRHMNGYGSHTFKLVNKDGEAVYCKFHYKVRCLIEQWNIITIDRIKIQGFGCKKRLVSSLFQQSRNVCLILFIQTDQGIKNLPVGEAGKLAGDNPDYSIQDLYEAIEKKDFVSYGFIFVRDIFCQGKKNHGFCFDQ